MLPGHNEQRRMASTEEQPLVTIPDVKLPDQKPGVPVKVVFNGKNNHAHRVKMVFEPKCGCTSEIAPTTVEAGQEFTLETKYDGSLLPIYYKKGIKVTVTSLEVEPQELNIYFEGNIV